MIGTLVVGGGPAGCAAAIALAEAGHAVLLIEREAVTREKVCGEFLGVDALALLARLGVDARALGGVPIQGAQLAAAARATRLDLPFDACGLPRATLDAALLARAVALGVTLRRGVAVSEAAPIADGWQVRLADGDGLRARRLLLATGKHELRGLARDAPGGSLGLKLPLRGVPIGASIALLACAGGYAGLQPRPGGEANLCAALDPAAPGVALAARDAAAFVAHVAAGSRLAMDLLRDALPLLARPLAVAGVPYGWRHRGASPEGLFRLGDQAAVIPSLCGDGVAMALASGLRAAAVILAGQSAAQHDAAWRAAHAGPMRVAGAMGAAMTRAPGLLVAGAALAPAAARWAARRTRIA
jgi:flavin-dependent dehydrogenase